MKRAFALVLLSAATMAGGRDAQAQAPAEPPTEPDYTFDGNTLRITEGGATTSVDLGCIGRAALRSGTKLLVACGAAGVIEIDMSDPAAPRRDGTMQIEGDATGLFQRDGRIWVEVASIAAHPVRIDALETPPRVSALPGLPPRELPPRPAEVPTSHTKTARAEVATEAPSVVAPPRLGDVWELSLLTSAFISIGSLGAGVLGSSSVVYRFSGPFVLRAEVAPYGFGGASTTSSGTFSSGPGPITPIGGSGSSTHQPSTISTAAGHFLAGIDTQLVEVAVGVGSATVNSNLGSSSNEPPDTSGLSIAESARIGARDGLAINVESTAVAANGQFNLGLFTASVQIPLSRTAMLMVRGGGGPVGFGYGDVGVRVLVHGDGGKGTVALTGFAGGATIMLDLCSTNSVFPNTQQCNELTLAGPSLGGGFEWKL